MSSIIGFTGLTNGLSPTPDLIYTDDISDLGKFSLVADGDNINVISPLDNFFPFNRIEEFADENGNIFVKFPKLYMKWILTTTGAIDGIKISDTQIDATYFIPDAFLDPRDIQCKTYLDYFALGKYEMSGTKDKIYSKTNASFLAGLTRDQTRIAARSYGIIDNYYLGYQQLDYSMLIVYNFLVMMYYKTANIQSVYPGRIYVDTPITTGTCDSLSGMNGWNTTSQCVKMLGIENPYGHKHKWIDGINFQDEKIYIQRLPQDFSDVIDINTNIGISRSAAGYISEMKPGVNDYISYCYPTAASGNQNSYYGDYTYYGGQNPRILCAGGSWSIGYYAGLWCLNGFQAPAAASGYQGGRLAYRPISSTPITVRIEKDLSTFSGWSQIPAGEHKLSIVAKAQGWESSIPAILSITKE